MDAPIQPVEPQSNGYIIAIVICIIIGLLYYFISPYVQTILDFVETLRSFGDIMSSLSSTTEPTLENNEKQKEKQQQKQKETENKKIKPPKPPTTTPQPDDSSSSIQGSAGYCYVGEWKGVRSCVKVDKNTCNSKLYTTEELCVNPTLRP